MKTSKIILALCLLSALCFSSCKEDRMMHKQAGVWEIKNWQYTTYDNGVIVTDTNVANMGYLSLYDSGLNGQNQTHYKFNSYSPPCWTQIANNNTLLDPMEDYCWWESDPNTPNRFSLITLGSLGEYVVMMFTLEKVSKNKELWTFITTGSGSNSSMNSKNVFTMERTKK